MDRAANRPVVIVSNQMELLADALGDALFQKGSNPFAKKLIIIPHPSLKRYLSFFLAKDPKWNVCAGVEFKVLLDGVMCLCPGEKILSQTEVSFLIEKVVRQILVQEEGTLFNEIKKYIKGAEDKKIVWISAELSRLFYEYAVLEPKGLEKWLLEEGWKQEIWRRVFSSQKKFMPNLLKNESFCPEVYIFGFAHLPAHFYDFFCSFTPKFYFLSPSEMFWEDLCSDKERIYLEKKMVGQKVRLQVQEQMQFLLKKTHPLLANWGKVGRSLLTRFGQRESDLEERYISTSANSALGFVQNSLLALEDDEEKKELLLQDSSLLFVSATSPLREVEVLLQTLVELMSHQEIAPKDVLVLSADLDSYLPYIHAVFGAASCPFSYSIQGTSAAVSSKTMQAMEFFFSLVESRFEKDLVLQFLSFPSVSKKWDFNVKDLSILKRWASKVHILWGLSPEHKKICLQKTCFNQEQLSLEGGSWQEGIKKLLLSLAYDDEDLLIRVHLTEAPLLGRFIHFLRELEEDVRVIYEGKELFFEDWTARVKKWLRTYFDPAQEVDSLCFELESLQKGLQGENLCLSFASFRRSIDLYLQKKKASFQVSHLQAVQFLPLEMSGAFPAKILYVLGVDEESFPKRQNSSCFDEMLNNRQMPSLSDQGRYLFLELILHARSSLIFSYQRVSKDDQKKQGPSRLVQELMDYLDRKGFFLESKKMPSIAFSRHHPSLPFARSYFQEESHCKSFCSFSFNSASSYYKEEKKELYPFFSPAVEEKQVSPVIELKKIQDFAKNPVRFYLKEQVGIFFDFVEPLSKEFFLAPFVKKRMKIDALTRSLDEGIFKAKATGAFPKGELSKIAERELAEDLQNWKKNLLVWGLCESDLFSLQITDSVRKIEVKREKTYCPLLSLEVEGFGRVCIQGELFPLSSKGFLWLDKADKEDLFVLFPTFLIFLCLAEEYGWEKECLLLQKGKKLSAAIPNPKASLAKYLNLYLKSLKDPFPIYPKWMGSLLTESPEQLTKKMTPSFFEKDFIDPYDQWMERRGYNFTALDLQESWKQTLSDIFSPLVDSLNNKEKDHADI